jgi:general secretion pathway protein H
MPISAVGNWNNRRGFTLIELAVVLVLLSLFVSLGVPLLNRAGDGPLRREARYLGNSIRYLADEAALSGRPHRLVFDFRQQSVSAQRLETDASWTTLQGLGRSHALTDSVRLTEISLPGQGRFSNGRVALGIEPGGWLDAAVLYLRDDKGRELTLQLLPLTGAMDIYEGHHEFSNTRQP